ncbi:hypothetical protein BGX38DRAFT_1267646 [Terfezia claveryi]|nr:hypothetical protein BGX38DRAFT_1267646 [Terfezia claveryi]
MQKISKAFPEEPLEDHIHVFIEAPKQVVPIITPNLEKDEGIKRKLDALEKGQLAIGKTLKALRAVKIDGFHFDSL